VISRRSPKQVLESCCRRGHRVSRMARRTALEISSPGSAGSLRRRLGPARRLAPDRDWARSSSSPRPGLSSPPILSRWISTLDQLLEPSAHEPTHTARRSPERRSPSVRATSWRRAVSALGAGLRGTYRGPARAHSSGRRGAGGADYGARWRTRKPPDRCLGTRAANGDARSVPLGLQHDALAPTRIYSLQD